MKKIYMECTLNAITMNDGNRVPEIQEMVNSAKAEGRVKTIIKDKSPDIHYLIINEDE